MGDPCSIVPPLSKGISYTQVSSGLCHIVLLRSARGTDIFGRCSIPPLDEGMFYAQVSASGGFFSEVMVKLLLAGRRIVGNAGFRLLSLVLTTSMLVILRKTTFCNLSLLMKMCCGLDGHEVLRLKAQKSDNAADIWRRVARESNTSLQSLKMVLPDGQLFVSKLRADPFQLSDVI